MRHALIIFCNDVAVMTPNPVQALVRAAVTGRGGFSVLLPGFPRRACDFARRWLVGSVCFGLLFGLGSGGDLIAADRAAASAPSASSGTRLDEAARFFATGAIPHLRIQIASTNMAKLQRDARS